MNGPYASSDKVAIAVAALGTTVIGSDDTILLQQAVVLAANLMD